MLTDTLMYTVRQTFYGTENLKMIFNIVSDVANESVKSYILLSHPVLEIHQYLNLLGIRSTKTRYIIKRRKVIYEAYINIGSSKILIRPKKP